MLHLLYMAYFAYLTLVFVTCVCCAGLKFLVRICTDLGLKDAQDYANKLKKAEKTAKLREEVC